jgi:hypothetical protein
MIRNIKVLGLAVVAVLAMSAVVANAASAAQFVASSYPATFTGSNTKGTEKFHTEAGNVECDSHFQGTENEASSTASAHPEYTNCEAFGGLSATVTTTGCNYVFHLTSTTSASTDVACGTGAILVTAGTCKAEIKSQTGLEKVGMAASGGKITVTPSVTKIKYTVTQDGFLCPFNGTGNREDGEYTGSVTIANTAAGQTIGIE